MLPPTKKEILEACHSLLLADQDEKASKEKSKKPRKADKENCTPGASPKKRTIAVQWSKEKYYPLTDQLLTLIKAKPRYCQAFRFSKDITRNVLSGGKKTAELYKEIAEALFVTPEGSQYSSSDLLTLQNAVSNRVAALKKAYCEHREELGATGQCLVESGCQDEITAGLKLANVWAKIEPPSSIPHTNKCKAIADKVQEIADMDYSQRMKITKIKEQEKTNRSQAKYQSKHALEMAHMEFQHREAESACQHQLQLLEKQVELEHLRLQGHGHGPRHAHSSHVVPAPALGPGPS
ncbi:hypothetical protein L208DRAFT_1377196 [Tricholoma matsutake]|nr:hypothetical protein L208DRAFT_1377196 [Tricholoma matsutake 945]